MKRILDLFSGAGGTAMGYAQAGFHITGVDIDMQRHYPFDFYRGDVFVLGRQLMEEGGFDAIHASPPCQAYSKASRNNGITYPALLEETRVLLKESGLPYIIENVEFAPMESPALLCGSTFDLHCDFDGKRWQLQRHRYFESNIPLCGKGPCRHVMPTVGVYGKPGGSSAARGIRLPGVTQWREAMGIDWMTSREIKESIPPVYTEFLGKQLMERLVRVS